MQARLPRRWRLRPRSLAIAACLSALLAPLASPLQARAYVPWGTVLVSGGQWAGTSASLGDLNVYSNGDGTHDEPTPYGLGYECVELAARWAQIRFGEPAFDWDISAAYQMWAQGPTRQVPFRQLVNGGGVPPQFGDLLIFNKTPTGVWGHVAVVSGTEPGFIDIVEQNWGNANPTGRARLPILGTYMPDRFGVPVIGWLRASNAPPNLTGTTPPGVTVTSLPLGRYVQPGGSHWVTTGSVTTGWTAGTPGIQDMPLGSLQNAPASGLQALMSCVAGPVHFLSLDPGCEGASSLGVDGYDSPTVKNDFIVPLWRCRNATTNDHFVSTSQACDGQTAETTLGYSANTIPYFRYYNSAIGDHLSATGSAAPGYEVEGILGEMVTGTTAQTHPLYECAILTDTFTSVSSTCEGQRFLGLLGQIASVPSASSAELFRCRAGKVDHFDSTDPRCEGQVTEGSLGFLTVSATPEQPTVNLARYIGSSGTHWVTANPVTDAFVTGGGHLESSLGELAKAAATGLHPLYSCQRDWIHFLSYDAACEGATVLGLDGYASNAASAAYPLQIFRCRVPSTNDHFVSLDSACEGQAGEGSLGFVAAKVGLTRYFDDIAYHSSTVGSVPSIFHAEYTLGDLSVTPLAGGHLLYSCAMLSDDFTSVDPACEGQSVSGPLGWASDTATSVYSVAVYRCLANNGTHFDSVAATCEGATQEAVLGYLSPAA